MIYFDKELKKIVFWQLNINSKTIIDEKSAIEELNLKLLNAVNSHLIGDVKIEFCVWWFDSSLIAHYLNKSQNNIEGFGSSVKENGYGELNYINGYVKMKILI